jgi:hypothetical protein
MLWLNPEIVFVAGFDETDSAAQMVEDPHLNDLLLALRSDFAKIVTFSPEDLQVSVHF